jgi:hypothetical protein
MTVTSWISLQSPRKKHHLAQRTSRIIDFPSPRSPSTAPPTLRLRSPFLDSLCRVAPHFIEPLASTVVVDRLERTKLSLRRHTAHLLFANTSLVFLFLSCPCYAFIIHSQLMSFRAFSSRVVTCPRFFSKVMYVCDTLFSPSRYP